MSEGSEDEEDGDRNRRARERAAKAARKREDVEALGEFTSLFEQVASCL